MASTAQYQGTVRGKSNFDAENEAKILRKAMKGFGTDEKAIIDVVGYCSREQRLRVASYFKQSYGKDLIKELDSEISGHFKELCIACFEKPDEYDAKQLRGAMAGIGTTESTLIEIMCTRSNAEIMAIKAAYKRLFSRDLEKDLISETSGHFKKLLVSMCNAGRDESLQVNDQKAMSDAKDLLAAGKQRLGTDESEFNRVIAARSYAHLRKVFANYQQISGQSMEEAIKSEFSGDIRKSLKTIVQVVNDPPTYFAHLLHKSMKGIGTSDTALIRVVVTRSEVDMVQIKQRFQSKYGKTLASFIKGDTSGDYEKLLLTLIGELH